jgi:uncharacterized protein (TIGR02594 family)
MKPVWLDIAEGELGTVEKRGGENPRILEYHATTTLKAREDEVAWCASFVNWCMEKAGIKGTGSAAAKSWLTWGDTSPQKYGAVCVIKQKSKGHDAATGSASGYHVAFFLKIENGRVFLLGGNQGDQVKISSFGLGSYEVCGYRWPTT